MYIPILFACFATFMAYTVSHCDFWGPLRHIPGPFWSRITRVWEWIIFLYQDEHCVQRAQRLHEQYGPVVRLAPGRYSINDPAAAREIYGYSSKFAKTSFYRPLASYGKPRDVFTEEDIHSHAITRRHIANLYSMSTMKSYSPFVDDLVAELIRCLNGLAQNQAKFSFPDWMQYFAFDVVGVVTFGEPFGIMRAGHDHLDILENIEGAAVGGASWGLLAPEWTDLQRLSNMLPGRGAARTKLDAWVQARLDENRPAVDQDRLDTRSDFNEKMLSLIQQGKLTNDERYNVTTNNIGAGSDTTGTILGALGWYLGHNPDCVRKLRQEISTYADESRISNPVTFAEAQEMPYLQALIKETLRMNPPLGLILPRVVPPGGAQLCGYHFPEGTVVGSNAWNLNYHPDTFGPDVAVFRPERWLDDLERSKHMEAAMFSFGGGARTCIGKNLALLEISKLVPEMYRRFDFELCDAERTLKRGFIVKQQFEMRVKILEKPL